MSQHLKVRCTRKMYYSDFLQKEKKSWTTVNNILVHFQRILSKYTSKVDVSVVLFADDTYDVAKGTNCS